MNGTQEMYDLMSMFEKVSGTLFYGHKVERYGRGEKVPVGEFYKDGSHRVLWDNAVGNAYEHPNSEIVGVPQLTAEQVAEQDDEAGVTLRDVIEFYQDELASEFLS